METAGQYNFILLDSEIESLKCPTNIITEFVAQSNLIAINLIIINLVAINLIIIFVKIIVSTFQCKQFLFSLTFVLLFFGILAHSNLNLTNNTDILLESLLKIVWNFRLSDEVAFMLLNILFDIASLKVSICDQPSLNCWHNLILIHLHPSKCYPNLILMHEILINSINIISRIVLIDDVSSLSTTIFHWFTIKSAAISK